MISKDQAGLLLGKDLLEAVSGDRIGEAVQVYLDAGTGLPEWVMTRTGILGTNARLVPLAEARLEERGIVVPYEKDTVTKAPEIGESSALPSRDQELQLYEHYGLGARTSPGAPSRLRAHLTAPGADTDLP
ncbi:MAG: PRC-barrel domain containing protein [Actinomycetota bacterium]|nr:PRC-barrel domain containing protein [Actinomycetota bacterium]